MVSKVLTRARAGFTREAGGVTSVVSAKLYIDSTVDGDLGVKAADLSGGEVVPACVVGVVHVVVDRLKRKGISDQVLSLRCQS